MVEFTYYTIIGRDLNLLKGHVDNVKKYAGFNNLPCEKEFLVIIYYNQTIPTDVTASIVEYCRQEGLVYYLYKEPTTVFIDNLYVCWNLGYERANGKWVFRGGSDQVFSKDSFISLYNLAKKYDNDKIILQANTIENRKRLNEIHAHSRHISLNLGDSFQDFSYSNFESVISQLNLNVDKEVLNINECLSTWGKPTKLQTSLGNIDRVDGCSWLMKRTEWQKYGPLPVIENGITGDVLIHDRMQKDGYEELLVRDCITYHFVRGESKDKY